MKLKFKDIPLMKELVFYNIELNGIFTLTVFDYNKFYIQAVIITNKYETSNKYIEYIKTYDILDEGKNIYLGEL